MSPAVTPFSSPEGTDGQDGAVPSTPISLFVVFEAIEQWRCESGGSDVAMAFNEGGRILGVGVAA